MLASAVDIASIEGLDGLSIGRLAADLEISKSGLIGPSAPRRSSSSRRSARPGRSSPRPSLEPALQNPVGIGRVRALLDAWMAYSSDRRFPGGCFFARASHEYAARPGAVRDALAVVDEEWLGLLASSIKEAQDAGEIDAGVDAAQLAFDLDAYLDSANLRSLLGRTDVYERAERAMRDRLEAVRSPS